jgi:hypothetical protein
MKLRDLKNLRFIFCFLFLSKTALAQVPYYSTLTPSVNVEGHNTSGGFLYVRYTSPSTIWLTGIVGSYSSTVISSDRLFLSSPIPTSVEIRNANNLLYTLGLTFHSQHTIFESIPDSPLYVNAKNIYYEYNTKFNYVPGMEYEIVAKSQNNILATGNFTAFSPTPTVPEPAEITLASALLLGFGAFLYKKSTRHKNNGTL